MAERRDPFCCPHCGSPSFELERQITVWQTLTIHAVDPQGYYEVHDDALGETAEEHAFKSASCAECRTDLPVRALLPWTAPKAGE